MLTRPNVGKSGSATSRVRRRVVAGAARRDERQRRDPHRLGRGTSFDRPRMSGYLPHVVLRAYVVTPTFESALAAELGPRCAPATTAVPGVVICAAEEPASAPGADLDPVFAR